jgi:hypothetical protein
MNRTDVLTGRIVQRVIDAKTKDCATVKVVHGVDYTHDIKRLVNNLYKFFPNSSIELRKLNFGYHLSITVYYE